MKRFILIFLLFSIILHSEEVDFWKNKYRYMSTRTLATAGAQSLGLVKNDAVFLNPASSYSPNGRFIMGLDGFYSGSEIPNQFMFSVADSKTNSRTTMGLSGGYYTKFYTYELGEDTYSAFSTGISYSLHIFSGLIFGIGGSYLRYLKNGDAYIHTATFDVGLIYIFSPYLTLGVSGNNLTAMNKYEHPLTLTSSARVTDGNIFSLEFDMTTDFSAPDLYNKDATALFKYSFGVEINIINDLTLMGGYQINNIINQNSFGLGIEYFIPQTRMEFGFSYFQTTEKDAMQIFSFALKLYI